MVGSSSRGPSNLGNLLKPEIGAPGASVSAVAGTGTGTEPFGGTSGAAPMVSGAAALLQGAFPSRSPLEIKAVLMNTAETDIMNRPEVFGGVHRGDHPHRRWRGPRGPRLPLADRGVRGR